MCCFVLYNVEVCGIVIGRRLTSSSYSRPSAEVQDFTANTATACSSKISGALYQTTRRHVPEDFNFSIRCPKSLLCPNVCLVVAIHFNILTVTAGCNKELNFFWHTHTHTHTHIHAHPGRNFGVLLAYFFRALLQVACITFPRPFLIQVTSIHKENSRP